MNSKFKELLKQPQISRTEMSAAIQSLTSTECRILNKLLENYDEEEALEIFASMADEDEEIEGLTEYRFTNPDPYFEREESDNAQNRPDLYHDREGNIHVKNLSAFWLPQFALEKEIGGTVYSVFGSYEGTETIDKKVKRILANFFENAED